MPKKGKSTPPQKEETEKGFSLPPLFIAFIAIATLAIIFGPPLIAGMSESSTADTTNSDGSGTDGAGTNVVPVETEAPTDKVYLGENLITAGVSDINDNKGITIRAGETVFVDGIDVSVPLSAKLSNDEDRASFYISNVKRIGTDKMTFCICADCTVIINEIKGVLFLEKDGSGMTLNTFFNGESVKETRISIPPGKKIDIEIILYEDSYGQFFSRNEMDRVDIVVGAKKLI